MKEATQPDAGAAMVISLSGLPGSGKSTLARALAQRTGAIWLRIDTIEQAIRAAGLEVGEAGYRIAYALAADNLRLGRRIVADCVNPWMETRDAWRDLAGLAGARLIEVEVICSDPAEHRRRVETRTAEIPGMPLPDWPATQAFDYRPWRRARLTLDTSDGDMARCLDCVLGAP